ncbi:MAG: hypothetical protein JSR90_01155 [Proteobacteria bacterium]|nr:hypothetical protein [Pseudomonadota bacterium]
MQARPADRAVRQEARSAVENPQPWRHVAFLCLPGDEAGIDGEACRLAALGERLRLVGRVRLDGRADLLARLAGSGNTAPQSDPDATLCLRAYAAWGDRFTDFIAGDFSFSLWDGGRNRLLSVRDQLGKRPLFHAQSGKTWLISDSLDWIADRLPARALDDYWIADFLAVGFSLEFERTVYRDVRRLAPAHSLSLDGAEASVRRYWHLEVAEPLFLPSAEAYGERFRTLLSLAIADRFPSGRLGVALSGGLDSTTIAACAVETCGARARVVAACESHRALLGSEEDHYAGLVAKRLDIALRVEKAEALVYDPQWRMRSLWHEEPTVYFINAEHYRAYYGELAQWASVWLHGEGPDNALAFDRDAYFRWLWRRGAWGRLAGALLRYAWIKGGEGWAATARRRLRHREPQDAPVAMPPWLSRDLVERCHLVERLRDLGGSGGGVHPWHPRAMASFAHPIWASHFDDFRFLESLAPLVWRHPYLDLRVLTFLLSVPPVPWAWKKRLLRVAMRGRLPDEVVDREKSALPRGPHIAAIRHHGLPDLARSDDLDPYVDVRFLPGGQASDSEIDGAIGPHTLAHWFALRRH